MHLGFILLSTGQEIAPKLSREISKKLTKAFFSNSIGSTSKVMFMLCIRFCICIYRVPQQGNIYYLYNTSKVIFVSCIRFCIYIYDIYIYIYMIYLYISTSLLHRKIIYKIFSNIGRLFHFSNYILYVLTLYLTFCSPKVLNIYNFFTHNQSRLILMRFYLTN